MEHSELFNSSFEDIGDSKPHSSYGAFTANRLLHTAALLDYYYTPILCFFGAMGNCLSVTVFCSNVNHRTLSSSYYLSALAISDTGFLINLFVVWLDWVGVGVLATNFGCPFVMFFGQVTCFLSVWLTVAFTIERFFAVVHPLTKPRYCTVSKAKKVIFGLTTFALIAFSYVLLIAQVKEIHNHDGEHTYDDKPNSTEGNLISNFTLPMSVGKSNRTTIIVPTESECLFFIPVPEHCKDGKINRNDVVESPGDFDPSSSELDSFPQGPLDRNTFDSSSNIPYWINNSEQNLSKRIANEADINLNQSDTIGDTLHQQILVCTVPLEYMTISTVANYLDSMITLIIPFCLITFFNMRIAVCVWKLKDQRMDIIALAKINNRKPSRKSSQGIREQFNKIVRREVCQPKKNDYGEKRSSTADHQGLFTLRSTISKPNSPKTLDSGETDENKHAHLNDKLISKSNYPTSSSRMGVEINSYTKGSTMNKQIEIIDNERIHFQNESPLQPTSEPSGHFNNRNTSQLGVNTNFNGSGYRRGIRKHGGVNVISNSHSASESRVTKMLLLVSTVFIVLNFPSHAFRAAAFIQTIFWEDDRESQNWLHAAQQISNILLFNTNFAVNFLLYCLSGRNFRKSLWNVMFKKCTNKSLHWRSAGKSTVTVPKCARFESRKNDNESITFDDTLSTCIQGVGKCELETGI